MLYFIYNLFEGPHINQFTDLTLFSLLLTDIAMDWSDHALWWPDKNRWLKRSRSTLDQYGVQADAKLHFTPMHKNLRIQLPDLQIMDMRTDFSSDVFHAVMGLCKEIGMSSLGLFAYT